MGRRGDTPVRRPGMLSRAESTTSDDEASGSDRSSCIRALTPALPPEDEDPLSGKKVAAFLDEPQIDFTEEHRQTSSELLEIESYRSLPSEDVWPDLPSADVPTDEGSEARFGDDRAVPGDDADGDPGDRAPATIRDFQRVPSDSARFDDRIRAYLEVARDAAEPHLLIKKKS